MNVVWSVALRTWTGLATVVLSEVRCQEGKSECGLECGLEDLDWVSNSCTFRGEVSRREK